MSGFQEQDVTVWRLQLATHARNLLFRDPRIEANVLVDSYAPSGASTVLFSATIK